MKFCIQNLFEFGLKMKMEKIEFDKHLIWKKKKVTFWPNLARLAFFSLLLPRPALPGAAHRRLLHADALARTPRGLVCHPRARSQLGRPSPLSQPTSAASSAAARLGFTRKRLALLSRCASGPTRQPHRPPSFLGAPLPSFARPWRDTDGKPPAPFARCRAPPCFPSFLAAAARL